LEFSVTMCCYVMRSYMMLIIWAFLVLPFGVGALQTKRARNEMIVATDASDTDDADAGDSAWGGGDLLLEGVGASCTDALGASEAGSLFQAMRLCEAEQRCDYYVFDGVAKKVMLCRGGAPAFTKRDVAARIAVGIRAGVFHTAGFSVRTNYQAVCETSQIIDELRGVYDVGTAAQKCADANRCTHFTLSTVVGVDGDDWANTLWMCSGEPSFIYHEGWLSGAKSALPPRLPAAAVAALDGPSS